MTKSTIVILVELDGKADCPTGSAVSIEGHTRPFHGWLGLATAITELARLDDPSAQPHTPTNEGAHQ
jgi:hypothetical protein